MTPDVPDGQGKATRTRARIMEAAATVLKERGYASTRLLDVADLAGIQAPALYYHFKSREALIEEVVIVGQKRVYEHVVDALDRAAPGLDPMTIIALAVRAHLEVTLRDSNHASASIRTLGQLPTEIRERQLTEQRRYGDLWRSLIAQAVEAGCIDPSRSIGAVRMLTLGALNWVPEWWDPSRGSLSAIVAAAQTFILAGLQAPTFIPGDEGKGNEAELASG